MTLPRKLELSSSELSELIDDDDDGYTMGAETSVESMIGGVPDRMEVNVCSVGGFISA
jgi:hypothetical protein